MKIFGRKDPWQNNQSVWILAVVLFVLPMTTLAFGYMQMRNEIERWLPTNDPQSRTLAWLRDLFPQEERVIATWDHSYLNDPKIPRFKYLLEGQPQADGTRRYGSKYIGSVTTPQEVIAEMEKYKVDREEAMRRLDGVLLGHGPLKLKLSTIGQQREKQVKKLLAQTAKRELGIDVSFLDAQTEWQQTKEFYKEAPQWLRDLEADFKPDEPFESIPEHNLQVRWDGIRRESNLTAAFQEIAVRLRTEPSKKYPEGRELITDCFFAVGSPVVLSINLSEAGDAEIPAALAAIRTAAEQSGVDMTKLRLGGRPVAGSELNKALAVAAWNVEAPAYLFHRRSVIITSWLVGGFVAFLMLRSLKLVFLVSAASGLAVLLTLALVPATGSSLNMVLIVMPTLLMVLSMSGAIHVANYWKHAAAEKIEGSVLEAVMMARVPCALASVTTAIGLMSLVSSELSPVRQFGFYSAIGCLVSLGAILLLFPAMLQMSPGKQPKAKEIKAEFWHRLGLYIGKYRVPVMAVSAVVFVIALAGLQHFQPETRVIKYFPNSARVVQDYNFLEENLTGIVAVDVLIRFNEQAQKDLSFLERIEVIREIKEKLRQHPEISGALALSDFQPVTERPKKSGKGRISIKDIRAKAAYNKRSSVVQERALESEDSGAAAFVKLVKEPSDLITEGDAKLNNAGDEVWRIGAQVSIMSDIDYETFSNTHHTGELDEVVKSVLKYHAGTSHTITGMVPVFLKTQNAVLQSLIFSFALAFGLIAVVMAFVLKDVPSALMTMVPNVVPVAIVFGMICWSGITFDIGTVITASVALGIAVDGTLHLMTWFRNGLEEGRGLTESVARALAHCGPAMWQTSCVVAIGMFMLYPASLSLVSRFGWLMAALITAALFADIVLLPAMLAGPLGRLMLRTMQRRQEKEQAKRRESEIPLPDGKSLHQKHETTGQPPHEVPNKKYANLQRPDEEQHG